MKSILFILLCVASSVWAQPVLDHSYFAQVWLAEDGLPENRVVGVAQTSDGYLWVATQGGLVRFDGVRFQKFEAASVAGTFSNTMQLLFLDRAGRLWLAKEGGLVCIDGARVRALTANDGQLSKFEGKRSLAEDKEGNLWISYTRGTLFRLRNGQVDNFTTGEGLPSGGSCLLAGDRNGNLWFAKNGQVGVFRDEKFLVRWNLGTPGLRLTPARSGGMWICAGQRVVRLEEDHEPVALGEFTPGSAAERLGAEPTAMLEDRNGAVWVGTISDGLFRYDTNGVFKIPTSHPAILSLAEDREGNLWVGTRGGGLNRVQRRVTELIGTAAGLPFETVQSVCQDSTGALWIVGPDGVLARQDHDKWMIVSGDGLYAGAHATCVAADARGGVWVGTRGGALYRSQDGKLVISGWRDGLGARALRSLLMTRSGDLWIATDAPDLLYRLRGDKLQKYNLPPGYRFIRALTEDAAGNVWAGASDGLLVRVTGDTVVNETPKPAGLSIRYLHGAPNGDLWIGYPGFGAGRLRDGRLTRFSTAQGMPNDYVSQILDDGRGGMWFAGNQGIFQVREREFDDVAEGRDTRVWPAVYGRSAGLPGLQASFDFAPNALRTSDGRLFFSMLTGLAEVRPDRVRLNRLPPVVLIERIVADGKTFAAYQNGGLSETTTNESEPAQVELANTDATIRLPPGIQQVQFEFSALSLVAPESVQFRYRLEGLDEKWVDAGTRRVADYTHPPPGKYRLKVIACNNDGVWNETGASLGIVVEPHLWETLWFKVTAPTAAFGILFGSTVLVLRRRHSFQIERLEQQRALERERARIAHDLHDDLGVGLTEIGLLGDLAGGAGTSPETGRECLQEITGRARSLVSSLDEIVWAVNPANDTSESLSDYFSRYAQTLLQRASIRCRLEVADPLPGGGLNAERRHQLFLAFKEALNNVIRHSGATEVRVSFGAVEGGLMVRVADNGHSFKKPAAEGSHHGLVGMSDRLRQLGGRCEIISTEETGTSVTFIIPLGTAAKA